MYNIFNLRDTEVVICIILVLVKTAHGLNHYLNIRQYTRPSLRHNGPLCRETSRFVNLRGKQPLEGWQIWMFPYTEGRNCFIIFLPMFYRLFPLWGKIGLFGNVCQCFIGYLPCGGKLGCSEGKNRCCSAGNNRVVSRQRKFWQNISIILLSHD
jgi:hypothetical protein